MPGSPWAYRLWHELADDTHSRNERAVREALTVTEKIDLIALWMEFQIGLRIEAQCRHR